MIGPADVLPFWRWAVVLSGSMNGRDKTLADGKGDGWRRALGNSDNAILMKFGL